MVTRLMRLWCWLPSRAATRSCEEAVAKSKALQTILAQPVLQAALNGTCGVSFLLPCWLQLAPTQRSHSAEFQSCMEGAHERAELSFDEWYEICDAARDLAKWNDL